MSSHSDDVSDHDTLHPTENLLSQAITEIDISTKSGKKQTRQWAAWTRQEEENFFNALRQVGKNFDKITCQVQSKNKDQVRHYYYRLVRRMNKLLGPDLCLDAKNSKDTIAAMLRWWSLLEKYSCKSSKLHLKPRRFKIFIEALENQLLKDRRKMKRKLTFEGESTPSSNMAQHTNKGTGGDTPSTKVLIVDGQDIQKVGSGKLFCLKRNGGANNGGNRGDSFSTKGSKQRRRTGVVSSNAYQRWEQAAIAGVSLVADAAEQIERTSAHYQGEHNDETLDKSTCQPLSVRMHFDERLIQSKTSRNLCSQQLTTEKTVERSKLKLQLFPIDECTRKALEKDKHNPHLELTLSTSKKISSVLEHLNRKWGNCGIATGELILFPYDINLGNIEDCQNWTLKDNTTKAEDVYASIGSPSIFRLKYGWFSNVKDGSWSSQASPHCTRLSNLTQSHAIQSEVQDTSADDGDGVNADAMIGNYSPIYENLKRPVDSSLDKTSVPLSSFPKEIPPENLMQPSKPVLSQEENDGRISRGSEGMDDQKTSNISFLSSGDWADSLTNISVGELLSEVSRRGRDGNYTGNGSGPNPLQNQCSYDSFDAAVAAHISGQVEMPSLPTMISHGSILDGEETCDAFSFQKKSSSKDLLCQPVNAFVAGRETKCINSVEILNLDERDPRIRFDTKGDLESQEFNHLVPSTNAHVSKEDLKRELPFADVYKQEDSTRNACLNDLYWPDSLGPLDLDIRPFKYHNHDLLLGDSISLSGLSRLIASSLDTFQNCSFFSSDKKETSAGEGPISDYKIKGEV